MTTRLIPLLLTTTLFGCTSRSLAPQPVPVDHVECTRCRMLISTTAGAGEIVSKSEDPRFYDDVGCLAADASAVQPDSRAYVHLPDDSWVEAVQASFAQPSTARTAMGSGFVAFRTAAEAKAADRASRVLTWDEVVRLQTTGAER